MADREFGWLIARVGSVAGSTEATSSVSIYLVVGKTAEAPPLPPNSSPAVGF